MNDTQTAIPPDGITPEASAFGGEESLLVIPLGGVEEIGMNLTVFQYGDDIMVVDAGMMFPDEEMLGVDIVLPDFTYLLDNMDKIRGIVLTHGHEDHTGALPFILKCIDVPVFGTKLTLALVREKLKEHRLDYVPLIPIKPRERFTLGAFTVTFIRVTHSIVDGVALGIETPVGPIIHTGDFKLDPTPVDGELMDFHTFSEFAEMKPVLLLSDSTNAEKGGFTFSEKEVRRAFETIFFRTKGRIIVATFASNIHRIQQVIDVAVMFGRKVTVCGKSMVANAQIALDLGYLKMPENTWVHLDKLNDYPDDKIVIITTGSQGEPMSVLTRIATDEHKTIKVKEGDMVILSARIIPGNERSIGKIINHLMRRGADVVYEKVSDIHVSGHASKEELKLMINLIRPKHFAPIHGEYRHLRYHARLAERAGIPKENIFLLEDGAVLEVTKDKVYRNGSVQAGKIFIDGRGYGDVEDMVLRDRRRLAHDGVVIVLVGIEKKTKTVISGPEIISRGFIFEEASQDTIDEVRALMAGTLSGIGYDLIGDIPFVKDKMRTVLKKYLRNRMDRKPLILPIIMEV